LAQLADISKRLDAANGRSGWRGMLWRTLVNPGKVIAQGDLWLRSQ
jgi:hypothetical protein